MKQELEDGTLELREKGTPQGSVLSPVLANLLFHYASDRRMAKHHPDIPFERFADDALCHGSSESLGVKFSRATRLFLRINGEAHYLNSREPLKHNRFAALAEWRESTA